LSANGMLGLGGKEHSYKEELDDLVASECIYCGDIMIRLVARRRNWSFVSVSINAIFMVL